MEKGLTLENSWYMRKRLTVEKNLFWRTESQDTREKDGSHTGNVIYLSQERHKRKT